MTTTAPHDTRASDAAAGRRRPPVLGWLVAFALAWLVPVSTHLVGLDVLLPPLVVAGLMSLQRGAAGLLDRLVLSVAQLFPALCVAGLLFSVWPWRLHPVAMAGCALTALVLLSLLSGRRPARPGRFRPRDGVLALGVAGVAALTLEPFVLRDLGGRLGILMPGEDMGRHFLVYDMIDRTGRYAFMGVEDSLTYIDDANASGIRNYPQGVHFAYAVTDRFLRSATGGSRDGVAAMDTLIWLCLATFVFLALAVLWGLRRVAGPGVDAARLLPVVGLAAVWLYFGDPVAVLVRGFPNELVGLAMAAVLTAIVARPLTDRREQLVAVALLLVGVSFSYHLFLPYAVLVAALWAWRERLWRRPSGWLALLLATGPLLLTPLLNAHAASGRQLTLAGTAQVNDRPATVLLVGLALLGLLWRGGRRAPRRRTAALALLAAVVVLLTLGLFQLVTIGRTIYYYEKLMHLLIVVSLVALGGLARLMPVRRARSAVAGARPVRHGFVRRTLPAVGLVLPLVLAMVALGDRWHQRPGSNGLRLAAGIERGSPAGGRDAIMITRMYPDGGGMINVDLMSTPHRNRYGTYYGSVMQRTYRYGHAWYLWQDVLGAPRTLEDLEAMVVASPVPVRFFVYDPQARFLVLDRQRPVRASSLPGGAPAAFGDPGARNNIEAVEHLAAKYPDRVHIVRARPPDR